MADLSKIKFMKLDNELPWKNIFSKEYFEQKLKDLFEGKNMSSKDFFDLFFSFVNYISKKVSEEYKEDDYFVRYEKDLYEKMRKNIMYRELDFTKISKDHIENDDDIKEFINKFVRYSTDFFYSKVWGGWLGVTFEKQDKEWKLMNDKFIKELKDWKYTTLEHWDYYDITIDQKKIHSIFEWTYFDYIYNKKWLLEKVRIFNRSSGEHLEIATISTQELQKKKEELAQKSFKNEENKKTDEKLDEKYKQLDIEKYVSYFNKKYWPYVNVEFKDNMLFFELDKQYEEEILEKFNWHLKELNTKYFYSEKYWQLDSIYKDKFVFVLAGYNKQMVLKIFEDLELKIRGNNKWKLK